MAEVLRDRFKEHTVLKGRSRFEKHERLITFDPNKKERCLIHPMSHYRLAKLYEEKGWKGRAIENYEKFLDLWKDADSGFAEVADANKRLAELKGN